jgi:uncharacterized membrane protein
MSIIVFGLICAVIIGFARQRTLDQRCSFLQKQLKELVERFESISGRLARLEAKAPDPHVAASPAPVASVAPVAPRAEMAAPLPEVATLAVETPAPTTAADEAELELDDLAQVVKAMYYTPPAPSVVETPPVETSAATPATPVTSPLDVLMTPATRSHSPFVHAERDAAPKTGEKTRVPPEPSSLYARASGPTLPERAFAWLSGGNTVLRVGVVLLFIGLAFLLRYASEQFDLPVEYRYIGVALTALVLLFLGWRLREKQLAYGLILQGTGIAVLYLTAFAAYRLHGLLPSEVARAFLVLVTICSVILAVKQDALSLACAAVLGGFAAPILVSSGSHDHVMLFGYFALLSTGIALVAWFKAWRVLNLIGFVGTFGIGIAWGLRSYKPALFASTEPFLLFFFLLYVAIGLLFTRRQLLAGKAEPEDEARRALLSQSARHADYLDGSLVFGPPLIGFGLQCTVIEHIEFGVAFSAWALGLFYLSLAFILRRRETWRRLILLREIYLALGVVFGTLAIPLALDAQWTSAAWAVEGAGLYWLGLRQSRRLAQGFSLFLMAAAALAYLDGVALGTATLLAAPPIGALLLGAALLFAHGVLRRDMARIERPAGNIAHTLLPTLACSGLGFLYLLPPLRLALSMSIVCWALMGLMTVFAGLFLKSRTFLVCAFCIQFLGGLFFLFDLEAGTGESVLATGWEGLLIAFQVGAALIASTFFARQETRPSEHPVLAVGMNIASLAGLVFLNLTVLFKLNWIQASAVWAASGLLILWVGLWLSRRPVFYFGMLLEAVSGMAFALNSAGLTAYPVGAGVTPLMHFDFWTPAALTLAALAGAWRIQRVAARILENPEKHDRHGKRAKPINVEQLGLFSGLLLFWGIGWWLWTGFSELSRFVFRPQLAYAALLALAVSALVWMWLARREAWRGLALIACLLPPAAAIMVLLYSLPETMRITMSYVFGLTLGVWPETAGAFSLLDASILITPFGMVVWLVFFAVHLLALRRLVDLLYTPIAHNLHILGCWLLLAVLMLAAHESMLAFSAKANAWRWLGWALAPSLYLFWMSRERPDFWPLTAYPRAYRVHAAAPVALGLLVWAVFANLLSDGAAYPLPYLPLVNPLEIGLLLVLLMVYRWSQGPFARYARTGMPFCPASVAQILFGVYFLGILTLAVCRSVHHWGGVAFDTGHLLASMSVQAGLSLVWTLYALVMMIGGHRRENRRLWMAGAALVGVVVIKLFFVELGESGSLARVVSFIGVGALLLIVGYFSPLPPRCGRDSGD